MTDLKDSLKQSILQEPFYSIHKLAYADLLEEEGGDLTLAAAYRWMAANRIGQTASSVSYTVCIAAGTVEEIVWRIVERKAQQAELLVKGEEG